MKGSVNFMGFMAKEITPNDELYITTYSDTVPTVDPKRFSLRVEGLVNESRFSAYYERKGEVP